MQNQCQGCQAGWPREKHNPWPKGSKEMYFHAVIGGYKGEKVLCVKGVYVSGQPYINVGTVGHVDHGKT